MRLIPYTDQLVQLAAGLAYMHNLSPAVVHGDIKGVCIVDCYDGSEALTLPLKANILIDNDGNVRITDFDLSRIVDPESTAGGCSIGSWRWMAPELLLEPDNPVTTESDVWALGMTILEVSQAFFPHL
jgi:serine/threonine protein kinase